jgi:prevent-host-death family protein
MQVAVRQIKNNLSKYGRIAHDGERIVVTKSGRPWFDIVAHRSGMRRTTPLPGVKPTMSIETAIAPVSVEDLSGWI